MLTVDGDRRARTARHGRVLPMAAAAVALVLGALAIVSQTRQASVPPAPELVAEVWSTSARGDRMQLRESVAAAPRDDTDHGTRDDPALLDVDVDASRQQIIGFGAALTHSSAALLMGMSEGRRLDLLVELFDPTGPVRLSVLRVPLGGSDFVPDAAYTYDDVPAGEDDWDLSRFSTAADETPVRSLLRVIRSIAPDLRIVASPWSPPAWMKTTGSLSGGRLIDDDRVYDAYAQYLVRALAEYSAAGVPVDALTVQNEPQARHPDGYPGTDMPVADQVRLIEALGPALVDAGLRTDVLAFDHNWALHPADAGATPAGADPEEDYALQVLRSDAAEWVAGTAFHCYAGDASAQDAVHDAAPGKQIWVTECSGSHAAGATPEDIFAETLSWQARNLLVASLEHRASVVLTWNLVLDAQGGPHVGGCSTCTGVVTVDGEQVTRNAEYYVLAHASRFLPRGSSAVESRGSVGAGVTHVAFRTPGGEVVVILAGAGAEGRHLDVHVGLAAFEVDLPADALTTLRIQPGGRDRPRTATSDEPVSPLRELESIGVTVSGEPHAPVDPCCVDDEPYRAADGDRATRWATGRPQRAGDHLDLDLGRPVDVRALVLHAGATGDWPRGFDVLVSSDGVVWEGPVASGSGAGAVTAVDLPGDPVRHLRLVLTSSSDRWWSVAEVRVLI